MLHPPAPPQPTVAHDRGQSRSRGLQHILTLSLRLSTKEASEFKQHMNQLNHPLLMELAARLITFAH